MKAISKYICESQEFSMQAIKAETHRLVKFISQNKETFNDEKEKSYSTVINIISEE